MTVSSMRHMAPILALFLLAFPLAACAADATEGKIAATTQAVAPLAIQAWCQDQMVTSGSLTGPACLTNTGSGPAEYVLGNFANPLLQSWTLHQVGVSAGQFSAINTLESNYQPGVCIAAPTTWGTGVGFVSCAAPQAQISVNNCGWQICSTDCQTCIGTPVSGGSNSMSWERSFDTAFDFNWRGFGYRTAYVSAARSSISNLPLYLRTYFQGLHGFSNTIVASDSSPTVAGGLYQPIAGNSELFYQFPLANGGVAISSMQFGGSYASPPTMILSHNTNGNITYTTAAPVACGPYDSQTWYPFNDTGGFHNPGLADACKVGYAIAEKSFDNLVQVQDTNSPANGQWSQHLPMYQ